MQSSCNLNCLNARVFTHTFLSAVSTAIQRLWSWALDRRSCLLICAIYSQWQHCSPFPGPKPLSAVAGVCGRQTSDGRIEFLSELLHCITSGVLLTSESVWKVSPGITPGTTCEATHGNPGPCNGNQGQVSYILYNQNINCDYLIMSRLISYLKNK